MLLLLAMHLARAEDEPFAIGTVRSEEVVVVQPVLHPKAGKTEVGGSIGWMAFDPYLVTPNLQGHFELHTSEWLSFNVVAGVGYGLPTAGLRELMSPTYQVVPEAYRYLGSVLGGVGYAPIYGKLTATGRSVLHYDLYVAGRAGLTLGASVIPGGGLSFAPTVSGGVGARLFLGEGRALRVELRDDLLLEHRRLTDKMYLKQNTGVLVGLTLFSGAE